MMPSRRLRIITIITLLAALMCICTTTENANAATGHFAPERLIRVGSSATIYVEGTVACEHVMCPSLLRTDNDGVSFITVTSPPNPSFDGGADSSLDQIAFASTLDGFALAVTYNSSGRETGSALYATRDGARTWTRVQGPPGDFLTSITVASDTLYGVTTHCSTQNGNEVCLDYRLVHTSLSAKHWTSTPIPNGRSYPWDFLGNVAAFGPMVWMSEGAKWSLLVSSRDHGTSFSTLSLKWPALASVAGCDLTAFSTRDLWAACPTGMQVAFSFSTDGGAKWTILPTDQFMGTGGGFFDPVSKNLAYLDYGGSRPLYRVIDSGRHLTKVGSLQCSKINSSVNALVFTDSRNGLAVCVPQDVLSSAILERTINGGMTWTRISQ